MMVLDVCSPGDADKETIKEHLHMTHRRAKRAFDHLKPKYDQVRGTLFPIIQGGTDLDLREESLNYLSQYAQDGIAVGGVSVGESREEINKVIDFTGPRLPEDKPRYLMGV
jgi:queuine tRNA-ribosyltransferase